MTQQRRTSRLCWKLRCNEPALLMLSAQHDLDGFGMRDRLDAQEVLDTYPHPHHPYMRGIWFCISGKRASKSAFFFFFIYFFLGTAA